MENKSDKIQERKLKIENKKKTIQNQIIGKLGEDIATKYLESKGYKILERNFNCKQGEIDIIAEEDNAIICDKEDTKKLVFVEVKTRKSISFGTPAEAVNENKQKHMKGASKYYLYSNNLQDREIRFDVIEIFLTKTRYKLNHILQIF